MNAPKPQGKSNLLHQQILGALVQTRTTSWTHRAFDLNTGDLIETKMPGTALSNPLAGNVSNDNVDRAAKRWAA